MPCGKKFGKILKGVKEQYPGYSQKRQMKITWAVYQKQKKK